MHEQLAPSDGQMGKRKKKHTWKCSVWIINIEIGDKLKIKHNPIQDK